MWTALGVARLRRHAALSSGARATSSATATCSCSARSILLVLPLAPYLGRHAREQLNGVKLWIHVGPVTFQPVEVAKLLLVIFFASYFVEKREMLSLSTRRVGNRLLPDLRPLGPIAVAWVVSILVILFEHDIGFSLLLFVMFIAMLWVATGRWTYVARRARRLRRRHLPRRPPALRQGR